MLPDSLIDSLIIEFFDSVGIYIQIWSYDYNGNFDSDIKYDKEKYEVSEEIFKTRTEATNEAIIKANQIFNEL